MCGQISRSEVVRCCTLSEWWCGGGVSTLSVSRGKDVLALNEPIIYRLHVPVLRAVHAGVSLVGGKDGIHGGLVSRRVRHMIQ